MWWSFSCLNSNLPTKWMLHCKVFYWICSRFRKLMIDAFVACQNTKLLTLLSLVPTSSSEIGNRCIQSEWDRITPVCFPLETDSFVTQNTSNVCLPLCQLLFIALDWLPLKFQLFHVWPFLLRQP